jgi:hypothetical protein
MEEILFLIVIFAGLICYMQGCSTPSKEIEFMKDSVRELLYFTIYCENHKDELPPNIRERYEEMEKNLKRLKDRDSSNKGMD